MTNDPEPAIPGWYVNVPHAEYLADRTSLSVSGAKLLLPPSAPAIFRHWSDHGRPSKQAYDIGHAVHTCVLGTGVEIVQVDADNWRTNAAKKAKADAEAAGQVALNRPEQEQVRAMANAVLNHPITGELFAPHTGLAEVSLYGVDKATGTRIRGRVDWMRRHPDRLVMVDLKTAESAEPEAFARAAASYGYHQQDPWYQDLALQLELADRVSFLFAVVEKREPYLVNVYQLDGEATAIGRRRNRDALDVYRRCTESGVWPGYAAAADGTPEITSISLPRWYVANNSGDIAW